MRLVALDVGEKRIGVATADTSVKIAVPYIAIDVDGSEFAKIFRLMQDEKAKHLVVGLPRNSQGEETAQSKAVRSFIISLCEYFVNSDFDPPLVKFQDESLTSVIAEERLGKNKRKKRVKGDVDCEAAALILQDFLNGLSFEKKSSVKKASASLSAEVNSDERKGLAPQSEPKTDKESQNGSKKKSKMRSRVLKILAVGVAVLVVGVVGVIGWYAHATSAVENLGNCRGTAPVDGASCIEVEFEVKAGETTGEIAKRLEGAGVIRSALAMQIYLRLERGDVVLRVGVYTLSNTMTIKEVVELLQQGSKAETFRMTFLPGGTVADAKKRLLDVGFAEAEVDVALGAKYEHPVMRDRPDGVSLEGYIFGETYEFYKTATVEEILIRTFDELYKVVEENDLIAQFGKRALNLHQGITLASIVQREAHAADQPGVAQVFLLRLKQGIPLGSDVVIGYAADQIDPNRDKTNMSYLETIPCPWNSRRCVGLPPTPVASPGKSALMAVVNPADNDYLYFLTGDDGKMRYAHTEAEHQRNIDNYCKNMCKIL